MPVKDSHVMTDDLWTQLSKGHPRERSELRDLRRMEIQAELAHPQCCDLAKRYLWPYREVSPRTEAVMNDGIPVWKVAFSTTWGAERGTQDFLTIHFCPFCGAKLPGFRKKANPPPHIAKEGDARCGGCGERFGRFGSCFCSLPESGFEPDM